MTELTFETKIDAAPAEVWGVLSDFGNVYRFNPSVPTSHLTSDARNGLGATRHCDLIIPGASVEERIIDWVDEESYQVEIYQGTRTPPAETVQARLSVRAEGDRTIARMQMAYKLKGGVVGQAMDRVLVRRQYVKAATGLLAGLKHYIERGEEVTHSRVVAHLTSAVV